jgi:hypothetical protein
MKLVTKFILIITLTLTASIVSQEIEKGKERQFLNFLATMNTIATVVTDRTSEFYSIHNVLNSDSCTGHFTLNNKKNPIKKGCLQPEDSVYFAKLSSLAYCSVESVDDKNCCKQDDFLEGKYKNDTSYRYLNTGDTNEFHVYVLVSHDYEKMIVITPGTQNPFQLVTEALNSSLELFENNTRGMRASKYFNVMYNHFSKKTTLWTKLKSLSNEYPSYQFIFSGHSLGGAMATMLVTGALYNGVIKKTQNSPVLITYGQPRTGNDMFAYYVMQNVPIVYRYVNQGDAVPTVPPCPSCSFNMCRESFRDICYKWTTYSGCCANLDVHNHDDFYAGQSTTTSSIANYYHIGGSVMLDQNNFATHAFECPYSIGEFWENHSLHKQCFPQTTRNVDYHLTYLGVNIGSYCKNNK